jgi:Tfp pilus assembly protein PilF
MVALMRKLPTFVAPGLCLLLAGCQTPLFNDGLFSSLTPNKTLTTQKASLDTSQSINATKPRIGGRGWRNATTRAAEKRAKAPAIGVNNVDRLREYLAMGNDAMQKGLFDDARIQYETVLSLEPHHATAHHMLGRISDMSQRFDEAERHYLAALGSNREDGYLLNDLGYSYLQQGRLDEARQYLTQAITREPGLVKAKVNLAAVYAYGGDQRGALAWLRQVGSEQQAQETLAGITSRPAPWIMNGSAETMASNQENYTINKEGQVLDADGNPLTSFEEVQQAMGAIRSQQIQARRNKMQRDEYLESERIKQAMGQQGAFDGRGGARNNDANLNDQMQAIEQATGTDPKRRLNSRPIYVDPPGQNSGQSQGNAQGQYQPQNNGSTPPQPDWNPQGQIQRLQPGGQQGQFAAPQDPYSNLLNPAGPTGFPQQGYPNQPMPQGQPGVQGSTVPLQSPGSPSGQTQPPNTLNVPQQLPQQQYQDPGYQNQRFVPGAQNGVQPGYPQQTQPQQRQPLGITQPPPQQPRPQQPPANAVPRDKYGYPIQSLAPSNPALNWQPGNVAPAQGSSAPNPGFYGQNNVQPNSGPQSGVYAGNPAPLNSQSPARPTVQPQQYQNGNAYYSSGQSAPMNQAHSANGWNNAQQQPIQQLGFDEQRPMARIDRGQRIQQYSAADRQAMQLGMAAGSGALSPVDTTPNQTPQSGQQIQQFGNGTPQNNVVPNNGPQRPAAVAPTNSGFSYEQSGQRMQPGQFLEQNQQQPDRGYPSAIPANFGQLPGQANFQAPTRQIHGQSVADQIGQDPQTTQRWLRMPTSQADVTMPVAFSSSTQMTQQQSQNWQQPNLADQSWNDGILASPTTRPEFGQPHMTNPHLRPANSQPELRPTGPSVQTASWPTQQ